MPTKNLHRNPPKKPFGAVDVNAVRSAWLYLEAIEKREKQKQELAIEKSIARHREKEVRKKAKENRKVSAEERKALLARRKAEEKLVIDYIKSGKFKDYFKRVLKTVAIMKERDPREAQRNIQIFRNDFFLHSNREIRRLAIMESENALREMGVKK